LIALSSKPWICYVHAGKYLNTPLSYDTLDYTSYFSSEMCPEGIVSSSENNLRFLIPKNYGEIFNQKVIPTRYTPRKILVNKEYKKLIILESDHRSYPNEEKQ
jgi:splicing factor 3B subunit 3